MLTIEYAKDPFYNDPENETIYLTVKFVEMENEVPFTASPLDTADYAKELYLNSINGVYGPIGQWKQNPCFSPPSIQMSKKTTATKSLPFEAKMIGVNCKLPYTITALAELPDGLKFEKDTILGTPVLAGNFEMSFKIVDALGDEGQETTTIVVFEK